MPRGKRRDRDGVFTRNDRPGFWASWVDASRKRRKRKLEAHTLQQARAILSAEKARVEKTVTLGYAPPSAESLESVSERFLGHQKARLTPRSYKREDRILKAHLRPFFGEKTKLAAIRPADVQKYITHRSGEVSPASITKELNVLKHLLTLAVEWELIPTNPAHGVKAPRVPAGRVRYLQPTELRAVLEACPEWLRPIAGLAVATGMRRGELLGLRWLDVDLQGGRIVLPQTKNGEGRVPQQSGTTGTLSRPPQESELDRPCLRWRLCHPGECFAGVPSGLSCREYLGLPLPRFATHGGKLDEDAGSGHSHRRPHSRSQGFENGSTVSAPQPGLSVGCREALRHHVCGILADA